MASPEGEAIEHFLGFESLTMLIRWINYRDNQQSTRQKDQENCVNRPRHRSLCRGGDIELGISSLYQFTRLLPVEPYQSPNLGWMAYKTNVKFTLRLTTEYFHKTRLNPF